MDLLLCFGGCFLLAAFVLDVVSVASVEWVVILGGSTSGLWIKCLSTGSCVTVTRTDRLDVVRAMMIMSVIISGLALLVVIINIASIWISQRTSRWVVRLVAVVTFLSVVLTLIGILVSQEVTWDVGDTDYGYSFWLGVAAIVLFFIAGILFLVSAVRYHRARDNRNRLQQISLTQKEYPFIIPHYDYKSGQTESNGQPATDLEDKTERQGRTPQMYPFNFDYRYYPTTYSANGASRRDDSSVVNADLNVSRYSSGSGFPTTQLPSQQLLSVKNNMADESHSSVYSRSQPRIDTNMSTNTRTTIMTPSLFATPSLLGRSRTSSRVPRDVCGYPLNYNRDN